MRSRQNVIRLLLLPALVILGMSGCKHESGIDERHILGLVTLPPADYGEVEAANESVNDTIEEAEDLAQAEPRVFVGYGILRITGALSDVGYLLNMGYTGDYDHYKLTSGLEGDLSFELTWDSGGDYDMFLLDTAGEELAAANSNAGTETLDYTISEEEELFLRVVGKSHDDGYDGHYLVKMTGIGPEAAGNVVLGAYLNSDVDNLGLPVSAASATQWSLDEGTDTYWAPFDMYHVNSIVEQTNTFIDPSMQDGLDNNCDGIADLGQDTTDADGDGYAISQADCNDLDPNIHPGRSDDFGNGIDDDCDGWADNGLDGVDDDGDGQSEYEGDCNDADPTIYKTLETENAMGFLGDFKDNNCDGTIDGPAAEGDNDGDGVTIEDGDCNDADPTIYPCPEGAICIDYRDGKDNDCDADPTSLSKTYFDENFEFVCPGGGCSFLEPDGEFEVDPLVYEDNDGDGYNEYLGDCNDTLAEVFPGNFELQTEAYVNSDIDEVWVYAGTFGSANNTSVASGDLVSCEPVHLDLSEVAGNVTWDMNEDWLGNGGQLVPEGLTEVPLDCLMPPMFGLAFDEVEPNDCPGPDDNVDAWYDCAQDLPGVISLDGNVDRISGVFDVGSDGSYSGDFDVFHVVVPQDGRVSGSLDWITEGSDPDWYMYCWYGDELNPLDWYLFISWSYDKPETGQTADPLPAGTECFIWMSNWLGPDNEPYVLKLWMDPTDA